MKAIRPLFFYIWRVNWRWYITGLIVALACFGMSVEQNAAPNQEIVVRFNADSVDAEDADAAISEIVGQLENLGVADIQISEMLDGKLKVTYYSTLDVAVIKDLFLQRKQLQFGETAFNNKEGSSKIPFGDNSHIYKLEVVKIQNDYGSDFGFHGLPVEIKYLKDQFLNQIVSLGDSENNFDLKNNIEKKVGKNYHYNPLSINNTSHKIPEVRAGPLS